MYCFWYCISFLIQFMDFIGFTSNLYTMTDELKMSIILNCVIFESPFRPVTLCTLTMLSNECHSSFVGATLFQRCWMWSWRLLGDSVCTFDWMFVLSSLLLMQSTSVRPFFLHLEKFSIYQTCFLFHTYTSLRLLLKQWKLGSSLKQRPRSLVILLCGRLLFQNSTYLLENGFLRSWHLSILRKTSLSIHNLSSLMWSASLLETYNLPECSHGAWTTVLASRWKIKTCLASTTK